MFGADKVARLLAAMLPPLIAIGGSVQRHDVNGQPGAIVTDRGGT